MLGLQISSALEKRVERLRETEIRKPESILVFLAHKNSITNTSSGKHPKSTSLQEGGEHQVRILQTISCHRAQNEWSFISHQQNDSTGSCCHVWQAQPRLAVFLWNHPTHEMPIHDHLFQATCHVKSLQKSNIQHCNQKEITPTDDNFSAVNNILSKKKTHKFFFFTQ